MPNIGKRPEKLAIINAIFGLFLVASQFYIYSKSGSLAMVPSIIASVLISIISFVAMWRMILNRRQGEEQTDLLKFNMRHDSSEMFADSDEAVKLAERNNKQFIKVFMPVITIITALLTLVIYYFIRNKWNNPLFPIPLITESFRHASLCLGLFLAALVFGSFFMGASREKECRWLRPAAAWTIFGAILLAINLIIFLYINFNGKIGNIALSQFNLKMAKILLYTILVLGIEMAINFIIEFYRPRAPGTESKPMFESKILALFTEPGGFARNIANALDYQFGFELSEAHFYRFLERILIPFVLVAVVCIWLLSIIVVIDIDETAIRESFGKVQKDNGIAKILNPGLYFKLPYPFARIRKFKTYRLHTIAIGYEDSDGTDNRNIPDEMKGDPSGKVIVWDKAHHKTETPFIIGASSITHDDQDKTTTNIPSGIFFIAASIPVEYSVKDLYSYHYRHKNSKQALQDLASSEVVKYLSCLEFKNLMTKDRNLVSKELKKRIQIAADNDQLGVKIEMVGMHGLHPPVPVGKDFNDVIVALEEMERDKLLGKVYQIAAKFATNSQVARLMDDANKYKIEQQSVSAAEVERFKAQRMAFEASPRIFKVNFLANLLESKTKNITKYIVPGNLDHEVIYFNLERKLRDTLEEIDLTQPGN